MAFSRRVKKKIADSHFDKTIKKKSYDEEFKVKKLKVLCLIVNRHQGDYYINTFKDREVAASFLVYGKGTATSEIYDILGVGETKKDIVLSLVREDKVPEIKTIIENRFDVSKKAKGVAFFMDVDSIAGVLVYKFLTNTKENLKKGESHE